MVKAASLLLLATALLTSCSQSYLTVQTDYLSHQNLASYFVGTPDPRQNCPTLGERLIIYWSVPKEFLCYDDLHLQVTLRFRNREEIEEIFHIRRQRGTYIFSLLNEDYFYRRGILTHKIDLIGGGCILEEWKHQIWAELIDIPYEQPLQVPTDEECAIDWQEG